MHKLDLTFPNFPMGTHETPWDMKILLFHGLAGMRRKNAIKLLNEGSIEKQIDGRTIIVYAFHEAISSTINRGMSRELIISSFEVLWRFFAWSDENSHPITKSTVIETFKEWVEYQIYRSKIQKEVSEIYAYRQTSRIAILIARALNLPGGNTGRYLLSQTRMRRPKSKKKVLSTKADKQNLSQTFEFGHALKAVCSALDNKTVRGNLPISIELSNDEKIVVAGSLMNIDMKLEEMEDSAIKRRAEIARASLKDNESLFDNHKRSGLLNLRIESELLMFIAQTGMNVTQAARLQREDYRWKMVGEDLEVFRVYKGRRFGEAIFRCYKSYKQHLQIYLNWLDEVGFSNFDSRLFPLQGRGMIKAANSKIGFYTSKGAFAKITIPFFSPQVLRNTRVNWLLRRSRDVDLTALQMAHDKEVLFRDYERPHHQSASSEIIKFHKATDPTFSPPGPGRCIDETNTPEPIYDTPKEAPEPDCISPEGCLFCSKHRDIMSADYCWKLASHAKIKILETTLYKPSTKQEVHPAHRVIERINLKLEAIASSSEIRAIWVKDARDAIRSGKHHPHWNGHIQLMEVLV